MPWISRLLALSSLLILIGLMPDISGIDPSQSILRARAGAEQLLTAEALAAIRNELGLNNSALERLSQWFMLALQGDLGVSWVDGNSVSIHLIQSAKTSVLLMLTALCLTLAFCALNVAFMAKRWQQAKLDAYQGKLNQVLVSLPEYVIGLLLILIFSIGLAWFPPYGWQGVNNLWLPSLALALPATGLLNHLVNTNLKQVLKEPWVITWLCADISQYQILRFALNRTISSIIPQIAMLIIGLTGGAVAIEQIFAIPGLGRLLLAAAKSQDLPILQGGLLFLLLYSILISSLSIAIQRKLLGPSLDNGKLITEKSAFRLTTNPLKAVTSGMIFLLLIGCAIAALFRDPFSIDFARLASPNLTIPFGADALGRDLFARVGQGMFSTISMGLLATLLSLVVGLGLGFISRFSQGLIEITKALPYIITALLVAGLTSMSPNSALLAIVLSSWAPLASHCATLVQEAKAQPYTHFAPIWGTGKSRILAYYILPYVLPPLARHALLRLPVITLGLTSLNFIGLGAKPPSPEWGILIAENLAYIERFPQGVLLPIAGLVLLTIAINLIFDD